MTKERIENIIKGCKTEKQIVNKLTKEKISFEILTSEYGYMNIRIYTENGYIRIYQKRKEIFVDTFEKVKLEYSGIPTFFATNSYF